MGKLLGSVLLVGLSVAGTLGFVRFVEVKDFVEENYHNEELIGYNVAMSRDDCPINIMFSVGDTLYTACSLPLEQSVRVYRHIPVSERQATR